MKFIIEVEQIAGTGLYKAKGFNTLVFDAIGLSKLDKVDDGTIMGDEVEANMRIKFPNGTTVYKVVEFAPDGSLNCVILKSGKYTSLRADTKYVVVKDDPLF